MNTLALYAQSQALASSQEKTAVAENTGSATAQSNNLGDSSSSSTSSTTDTSGTSGTPTTTTSTETSAVDTFLTLFVAEIENQDPTDPTDPTAYIDQLSSMAQVAMMEEMSVQEVSLTLEIPESTVRTRYFRARSMLREGLSQDLDMALCDAFTFDGERCNRIVSSVLVRLPPR